MNQVLSLEDYETIVSAKMWRGYGWHELPIYDDGYGPLWIAGQEFGPTMLIRAQSFQDAWEIWIDESPTIPEEDLPEAYGLRSQAEMDAISACVDGSSTKNQRETVREIIERDECTWNGRTPETPDEVDEFPLLIEGYEYQSNATGTGIVDVGHYAWLREIEESDVLSITVEDTDDETTFVRWSTLEIK